MSFRASFLVLPLLLAACGAAPSPSATAVPTASSTPIVAAPVRIDMSETGFAPSTVTIKNGGTVTFVNVGKVAIWPASAPHPEHTDLPGFDSLKGIEPGSTYSYTFTQEGNWKFHDHINAKNFGSVTVEK